MLHNDYGRSGHCGMGEDSFAPCVICKMGSRIFRMLTSRAIEVQINCIMLQDLHSRAWGLTGGIGSGKSYAATILRRLGIPVLDMDMMARRLLLAGNPVFDQVVDRFGREIVGLDGQIDRKALAAVVFSDQKRRLELEGIIHPVVIRQAFELIESAPLSKSPTVFIESALIFAVGLDRALARTVLVWTPKDVRIRRVMIRDMMPEPDVLARISAQLDDDVIKSRADIVWENSRGPDELKRQIILTLGRQEPLTD